MIKTNALGNINCIDSFTNPKHAPYVGENSSFTVHPLRALFDGLTPVERYGQVFRQLSHVGWTITTKNNPVLLMIHPPDHRSWGWETLLQLAPNGSPIQNRNMNTPSSLVCSLRSSLDTRSIPLLMVKSQVVVGEIAFRSH